MPENDFLVWAASATTEIYTQSQYASLVQLGPGVAPGIADPLAYNKTLRQATAIASVIAQFIVAESGQPAIDDGTTATLLTNFDTAVKNFVYALALSTGVLNGTVGTPTFAPNPSFTGTATISVGGGLGGVTTGSGGSSYPGNMSFYNPAGTRVGYIGASNGANYLMLETENGYLGYSLTGSLIVGGSTTIGNSLTVNGNSQSLGISFFGPSGIFYAGASGSNAIINFAPSNYLEYVAGTGVYLTTGGSIVLQPSNGATSFVLGGSLFTANNAGLRASFGAYNSGDSARCVVLNDYVFYGAGNGYVRLPNGFILQWGNVYIPTQNVSSGLNFNIAFPTTCLNLICSFATISAGTASESVGGQPTSNSQFQLGSCASYFGYQTVYWCAIGY